MGDRTKRTGLGLRVSTNVRRNSERKVNLVEPVKPQVNQPVVDKENAYPVSAISKAFSNDNGKGVEISPILSRRKGGLSLNMIMENAEKIRKELEADSDWIDSCDRLSKSPERDVLLVNQSVISPKREPSPVGYPTLPRFGLPLEDALQISTKDLLKVHSPYPDCDSFTWKVVDIPISDDEDF